MGGSDPVDFTARAATWLADRFPGLGLTLLLGPAYRNEHALRAAFHGQRRIEIVRSPASILPLFQSADLILTSGGTTVWDLCCLGKPFAAVAIADVQRHLVQRLGQAGAALDLGWHEQLSADSLAAALEPLLGVAARRRLALAAFALVDGKGAARVADALEWRCGPPTSSDLSEECR
jgi:spore coat polysaccharide biosynthesis predicted glycosyltransferase SpsG